MTRQHETPENLAKLREHIRYDPDTGHFFWRTSGSGRYPGKQTGQKTLRIDGVVYTAGRAAFALGHGRWPSDQVDHRNRDNRDQRLCNLREATSSQNLANRAGWTKRSRLKGAYPVTTCPGVWQALAFSEGKTQYLGRFRSEQEAHAAYTTFIQKRFGSFAHTGHETPELRQLLD